MALEEVGHVSDADRVRQANGFRATRCSGGAYEYRQVFDGTRNPSWTENERFSTIVTV